MVERKIVTQDRIGFQAPLMYPTNGIDGAVRDMGVSIKRGLARVAQIFPVSETSRIVAGGHVTFEAALQLMGTAHASQHGLLTADQAPSQSPRKRSTGISYGQLSPDIARAVDHAMRQFGDPHDRT